MRRLVLGALLAVLLAPQPAAASWGAGRTTNESPDAFGTFGVDGDLEVRRSGDNVGPLRIRIPGVGWRSVPGSGAARGVGAAAGPGGLLAIAWASPAFCSDADPAEKSFCPSEIRVIVWRSGEPVPPPRQVSPPRAAVGGRVSVGIGSDGTVLVTWEAEDAFGDSHGVGAAVGLATGPLRPLRVAGSGSSLGVKVVRRRAQLASVREARGAAVVSLASASDGQLEASRPDARLPDVGLLESVALQRTRSGARLYEWEGSRGLEHVRTGAAGRPVQAGSQRLSAFGSDVHLGEDGEWAAALRATRESRQRLTVLRGRAGSRRLRRDRFGPPIVSDSLVGGRVEVAVDRRGETVVVWATRRRGRAAIAGAGAAAGRPFTAASILSSPSSRCDFPYLDLLEPRGPLARWICRRRGGRDFVQRARYR